MSEDNQEAKPEAAKSDEPLTVKLRKPIQGGDGVEVLELKFREPTAADIEACGNPVNIDFFSGEVPKVSFDAPSMSKMLSRLAAVPPSSIKKLNTRDWNSAAWTLARFFLPDM